MSSSSAEPASPAHAPIRPRSGRLRLLALMGVAALPGFLKRPLYRWCFGYRISRTAQIGIALLDCRSLEIGDFARIASATAFLGCGDVRIGRHVAIGPLNLFRGGRLITLADYAQVLRQNIVNAIPDHDCTNDPDSVFEMGFGAVMTAEHRVDFTARVSLGRRVTFGGRNSSIWTHNRRVGLPVDIGDYSYVGSEIRMAPGSAVPPFCIVGMGAVITRHLTEPYSLIVGVPAKIRRPLDASDEELLYGKTRRDLPDEPRPARPGQTAEPPSEARA
jgi:acetyltransferase-like isoleucine patch superfamily enzyme